MLLLQNYSKQVGVRLLGERRWPRGRADVSEPGGPGFDSSSMQPKDRRSSGLSTLRSTPPLVLCCAWLVTMTLHVHCARWLRLGPINSARYRLLGMTNDYIAAKHCGRAKRSRISDTHRLRSSLHCRYINNQSLLCFFTFTPLISVDDVVLFLIFKISNLYIRGIRYKFTVILQ